MTDEIDPEVVDRIRNAWSDDTAGYARTPASKGQCAVTALIVQDLYGGKLIRGQCGKTSHYWNELPDGTQVDLTRDQFEGRDEEIEFLLYRDREYVLEGNEKTKARYELLKERAGF